MSFPTRMMKQTVTRWQRTSVDGFTKPTFAAPATTKCRWQDKHEIFTSSDGREKLSTAVVYIKIDVSEGDYLYLGTSTVADPHAVAGAYEVKKVEKSPSISAKIFLRKVML